MCAIVCPFDAVTYHAAAAAPEKAAVATKCDNCLERQRLGAVPACVEACKVGALEFGELNELVKAARGRYAGQVLQQVLPALGQVGAPAQTESAPTSIQIWRGWGAAVSGLNAGTEKGA